MFAKSWLCGTFARVSGIFLACRVSALAKRTLVC